MNWFAKKKLEASIFFDYLRPVGKVLRWPLLPVTWPLKKMGQLSYTGLKKSTEGVQWTAHATRESVAGVFKAGVSPWLMLAKSRLVTIKRFLWDTPIAAMSAAIRTPIALAKSPLEMVRGVRDAIKSVPGNARSVINAVKNFHVMDTIKGTRDTIRDLILPPIARPIMPILKPPAKVIGTAAGAELQTLTTIRQALTETIPEGGRRIWQAPATASAILAAKREELEMKKAVLKADKEKKREALKAEIAKSKGEPSADEGEKKSA